MNPPLIITAALPPAIEARLTGLRERYFPAHRNVLDAHLTLFHALPHDALPMVTRDLGRCVSGPTIAVALVGLKPLGRGFAVVVEAPSLRALHKQLVQAWSGHLTPQDSQPLWPHITLQNKVDPSVAKRDLALARAQFAPETCEVTALRVWRYLGGPWELHEELPFRSQTP